MPFTGSIQEIWAVYDSQHLTIWKPGMAAPKAVEVPPGKSWELHVKTVASYPEVGAIGAWSTAVTIANDVSWGQAKLHDGTKGDYEFARNMGSMPSTKVDVDRVKFWWNTAYTNTPPPSVDR